MFAFTHCAEPERRKLGYTMRVNTFLTMTASIFISTAATPPAHTSIERVAINDNRVAAGVLKDGVLTVRLEVRPGQWHPDKDSDPGVEVLAFAEEGKPVQIPGPLIRVPEGTEIRISLRNGGPEPLTVHGLYARGNASRDSVQLEPGAVREVRFAAGVAGTYYYWAKSATTTPVQPLARRGLESQLSGAIVVDPRGTSGRPRDRVFVMGLWADSVLNIIDDARTRRFRFVINGKSWPNTERLTHTVGDSIHWRVINASSAVHPMHLHGFYYRVDSRGDERIDSVYGAKASPHMVVTDRMAPGRTISMSWVPERSGNWVFHCHDNVHITPSLSLEPGAAKPLVQDPQHVGNHAEAMMAGLVMGVHVQPNRGVAEATQPSTRRKLRLVAAVDAGGTESEPAYGFLLNPSPNVKAGAPMLPGPTIVLKRGEPVGITVVNELPEPTAVHWHGIELESYFDGVAGFSGKPGRISPAIAPRDSFEARFTPPRAGTFIYHTHVDEVRQQRAGLAGALIVLDPGATFDPATDIPLMISTPRLRADNPVVLLNGSNTPAPLELKAGVRHRLRIINIHIFRPSMRLAIKQGDQTLTWRALAKDGWDLPAARAVTGPALQQLGNGETYDFEFVPAAAGELLLEVTAANGLVLATMPIRVR
jgi:FtsP/CotA-like multicopper oxidase with cupredoxin domain